MGGLIRYLLEVHLRVGRFHRNDQIEEKQRHCGTTGEAGMLDGLTMA